MIFRPSFRARNFIIRRPGPGSCLFRGLVFPAIFLVFLGAGRCLAAGNPGSTALSHYITGMIYNRRGEQENSIREFRKALKADPQNVFIRIKLAVRYMHGENYPAAIDELQAACKLRPDMAEPHALLSLVYYLLEEPDKAIQEYESALSAVAENKPDDAEISGSLGRLYLYRGKLEQAEQVFRKTVSLSPSSWEAHYYLGDIHYRLGDKKGAEKELVKAIALNADCHQALNYLAYMYIEEGRNFKEAEAMVKRAVSLQPDNGAYVDSLGWLYFKKGMMKEAGRELNKAASLLNDPVIFDHLGDFYIKTGNKEKAAQQWRQSLQLDPKQETVKAKLAAVAGQAEKDGEPVKNGK